ncbi:MAG: hypothetical protein RLZZ461_1631 [Planctomycetota bacterium]
MSRGTQDILDQLPGIESRPRRLDRDARRALGALLIVTVVAIGMAWQARSLEQSAAVDTAANARDPLGAMERLRVTPDIAEPATSATDDGYESIDAIGPGRRS